MSVFVVIGWIVPPLLILWRRQREPRWLVYVRYVIAVLVVWMAAMMVISHDTTIRVRDARLLGDIDGSIADTGPNAAVLLVGWVPGIIYALLVGAVRWLWLWLKQKRQRHAVV